MKLGFFFFNNCRWKVSSFHSICNSLEIILPRAGFVALVALDTGLCLRFMYRWGNQINSWGLSSLFGLYPLLRAVDILIFWQFHDLVAASALYEWNMKLRVWLVWGLHLRFSKTQRIPGKGSPHKITSGSGWKGPLEVIWTNLPTPAAGVHFFLRRKRCP